MSLNDYFCPEELDGLHSEHNRCSVNTGETNERTSKATEPLGEQGDILKVLFRKEGALLTGTQEEW